MEVCFRTVQSLIVETGSDDILKSDFSFGIHEYDKVCRQKVILHLENGGYSMIGCDQMAQSHGQ